MTDIEYTPIELSRALDRITQGPRDRTAIYSWLDEATHTWAMRLPQLREAQRAFGHARYFHSLPQRRSEKTWNDLAKAAAELADALRPYADTHPAHCKELTSSGTCNYPTIKGNDCRSQHRHITPTKA